MKVLVTGFEPFGKESINASQAAVQQLPDQIETIDIIKEIIPTAGKAAMDRIAQLVHQHQPDVVLSVGQAAGRAAITIERVGINVDDYRIADNHGEQPIDQPIVENGPDAYLCWLPIKRMVQAIRSQHIPADISNTAGTFVCNHVCYATAHLLKEAGLPTISGFLHVPLLESQAKPGQPGLPLTDIVQGLTAVIASLQDLREDIKQTEGTFQ